MEFINLCKHEVYDLISDTKLPAASKQDEVRAITTSVVDSVQNGITIFKTIVEPVEIPPRKDGIMYIVSALALKGVPKDRDDVVCPGNPIREDGKVIGCNGFRCAE